MYGCSIVESFLRLIEEYINSLTLSPPSLTQPQTKKASALRALA